MNSTILKTASRALLPIFLIASLVILWRGHNEPGGGFIGGLLAVIAVALHAIALGPQDARRALRLEPLTIAGIGLASAVLAGFWGAFMGTGFLSGVWPLLTTTPDGGKSGLPVGSILMFDTGVYLTVLGAVSAILFALEDAVFSQTPKDEEPL